MSMQCFLPKEAQIRQEIGVDKGYKLCYNTQALKECTPKYRGVEQLEARRAHNPEVVGSSPASATKKPPISTEIGGFSYALRT